MSLLREIFPGLDEFYGEGVPIWDDEEAPWTVISGNGDIQSQIMELTGEDDGVFIHPDAKIGDFVRIEGPSYIGRGAEIRHSAFIRGGSWICQEAVVGHSSEIKESILMPRAKAPHFNYVGNSIIGVDANLGAGVITANMRNDKKNVLLWISGERIDSGANKLGAIIGDGVSIGCNSVLNPGSVISPSLSFPPGSIISGEVNS